jgi:hypothetical protein
VLSVGLNYQVLIDAHSEATGQSRKPRIASSIYSRDEAGPRFSLPQARPVSPIRDQPVYSLYTGNDEPDISPPDSPIEVGRGDRDGSPDVSPLADDHVNPFADVRKKSSLLPVPRKDTANRNKAPEFSVALEPSQKSSARGLSETKKENVSKEAQYASNSEADGKSSSKSGSNILNMGKERFPAKIFTKNRNSYHPGDKKDSKPPREPWKGASGRSALVAPPETKVQSKKVRDGTMENDYVTRQPESYTITTISAGSPISEKSNMKLSLEKGQGSKPSPGPETPTKTGPRATPGNAAAHTGDAQAKPLPQNRKTVRPVVEPAKSFSSKLQDLNVPNEPGSRFSATTYAPTEAALTPPGSPDARPGIDTPPVPAISSSPIMTRRRPVPSAGSTTRKPTPSEIDSSSKALPQGPPEAQAQNRIDALEARRKDLSLRKANINTIIYELTQVIQPSSIAYDMATRDEVKKTVSSLNKELDDIQKEDHDIGMKLLRAYRKQDQADQYESSSLWVKRVTS